MLWIVAVALWACTLGVAPAHASEPAFAGLGTLPGSRFPRSIANAVSADGAVVVGSGSSISGTRAFAWTAAEGMSSLGTLPGGTVSTGLDVSADGSVVVGNSSTGRGTEAFRWTAGAGMIGLGDLAGGSFASSATGVSADGSVVVGGGLSDSGSEAFRWNAIEGMVGLGDLPGGSFVSGAADVSGDGSIVVGASSSAASFPNGTEAFRWTTAGGMVGLGSLPGRGFPSSANGVSRDGRVIVGASGPSPAREAFRWTSDAGMVGLGDLPGGGFDSSARAVSGDGSVVVGRATSASGSEAFVWDAATGMRSLREVLVGLGVDLTGWTLTDALGVSDDGLRIVGVGVNPEGDDEGWIAALPEPTLVVEIDVKPGSRRSPINPESGGVVPVAILGSAGFDVSDVDTATLTFGPGKAPPLHRRDEHFRDVNRDGYLDLVSHYRTQETGIEATDEEACVLGESYDGTSFQGCDTIRTVPSRDPWLQHRLHSPR